MAKAQLSVLRMENSWCLLLDGQGLGRSPLRSAAVNCALEIARCGRADGVEVELFAQAPSSALNAEGQRPVLERSRKAR